MSLNLNQLKTWFLADTEHLTPDMLEAMASVATKTKYTWSPNGILAAVSEMISFIIGNSKIWVERLFTTKQTTG